MRYIIKNGKGTVNAFNKKFEKKRLRSRGNKTCEEIFGTMKIGGIPKVYGEDYGYAFIKPEDVQITNPEHPDFGKYAIPVFEVDIEDHSPSDKNKSVDFDPTWRI